MIFSQIVDLSSFSRALLNLNHRSSRDILYNIVRPSFELIIIGGRESRELLCVYVYILSRIYIYIYTQLFIAQNTYATHFVRVYISISFIYNTHTHTYICKGTPKTEFIGLCVYMQVYMADVFIFIFFCQCTPIRTLTSHSNNNNNNNIILQQCAAAV